ncbi:MAG: heavy metal-binding domain-containing protein [Sedimentisphaerales bacterium]|nr:heavy metal-binding domain-containing protein [Sedimentisphaerales bacterium]
MHTLIALIAGLGMLVLGFIAGRITESRHLRRLASREQALSGMIQCNLRSLPQGLHVHGSFLVLGSAVIATDYFKTVAAGLRNIFGGEMRSYRSLMSRARREATVRMLEQARENGADIVWNVRYETSTIQGKRSAGGVEILAYGTAVKRS